MNTKNYLLLTVLVLCIQGNIYSAEKTHPDNMPDAAPLIGKALRNHNAQGARAQYLKLADDARDIEDAEIAAQADIFNPNSILKKS
jgi:hypothetical protein